MSKAKLLAGTWWLWRVLVPVGAVFLAVQGIREARGENVNESSNGRWVSFREWAGQPVYVLCERVGGQLVTRGTYLSDPIPSLEVRA